MNWPSSTRPELRFARIECETMRQRVYEMLRDKLMRGSFEPGQRLKIAELARGFGTSAMPVRGARAALESDVGRVFDLVITDQSRWRRRGGAA